MFLKVTKAAVLGLLVSAATAGAALANGTCPPGIPAGVSCGGPDLADVTAGSYKLDPGHAAVIARVSHIGYSMSVFRFDTVAGDLTWDPADPSKDQLKVTVEPGSIATPVPGFAKELAGPQFLKAAQFPQATFTSTAFRRTSPTAGEVDGSLTLMGKTAPVTFKVALVGAGKGFGHPRMGVHATTSLRPADFGMPPMFAEPIELVIDVEFEKAS